MFFDESKFNNFKKEYESLSFFLAHMEKEVKDEHGKLCRMTDFIANRQFEMGDKLNQLNEEPMAKMYRKVFTKTLDNEVDYEVDNEVFKKPKIVQLRRKADKKMRGFTQTLSSILSVTPFVNQMLCQLRKSQLGPVFTEDLRYYLAYEDFQMKISDSSNEGYNICLARQLMIAAKTALDPAENHSPLSNPYVT